MKIHAHIAWATVTAVLAALALVLALCLALRRRNTFDAHFEMQPPPHATVALAGESSEMAQRAFDPTVAGGATSSAVFTGDARSSKFVSEAQVRAMCLASAACGGYLKQRFLPAVLDPHTNTCATPLNNGAPMYTLFTPLGATSLTAVPPVLQGTDLTTRTTSYVLQ